MITSQTYLTIDAIFHPNAHNCMRADRHTTQQQNQADIQTDLQQSALNCFF